jgi:hypothetical protein
MHWTEKAIGSEETDNLHLKCNTSEFIFWLLNTRLFVIQFTAYLIKSNYPIAEFPLLELFYTQVQIYHLVDHH